MPNRQGPRYCGRAVVTFALAVIVGAFVGILAAAASEAIARGFSSGSASFDRISEAIFGLMLPGYALGSPIAAVAGLIAALHIARHGHIGALRVASIAALTPVLPLAPIGGPVGVLFGLFYAIPAVAAALLVRYAGLLAWRKYHVAGA